MQQSGTWNPAYGIEKFGLEAPASVLYNPLEPRLVEEAIRRHEAVLSEGGVVAADTGVHTGRSPKDKFVVADATTENDVWWDENGRLLPENFEKLLADFQAHAKGKDLFVQDLYGGQDPRHRIKVRVVTEYAWHSMFIRQLLVRPARSELADFVPDMTIVDFPSFHADPKKYGIRTSTIIAVNFARGIVLVGNSEYAGEMKKSVFTALNWLLPPKGIMPMHCSANVGPDGDAAIFFGLSGTGKTTLSADPNRMLIGDDEHGWSEDGIFNFEGGCYAKTIRLSPEAEPEIYATTKRFGSVLENVVVDPETREPDFDDESKTENTRCAYPMEFIPNAVLEGTAGHPKNIVLLTADAFGVMPPIARLTPEQAVYHFLSGYTAKVAGTEKGLGSDPEATFSTCFASPFLPRHPAVYGDLFRTMIEKHGSKCWLVNTGWTGGIYGVGHRMPIKATRTLLTAALSGALDGVGYRTDENFGFEVPTEVPGVDSSLLDPRQTWADKKAFDEWAQKLVGMFQKNFAQFEKHVDRAILEAGPKLRVPAE